MYFRVKYIFESWGRGDKKSNSFAKVEFQEM